MFIRSHSCQDQFPTFPEFPEFPPKSSTCLELNPTLHVALLFVYDFCLMPEVSHNCIPLVRGPHGGNHPFMWAKRTPVSHPHHDSPCSRFLSRIQSMVQHIFYQRGNFFLVLLWAFCAKDALAKGTSRELASTTGKFNASRPFLIAAVHSSLYPYSAVPFKWR